MRIKQIKTLLTIFCTIFLILLSSRPAFADGENYTAPDDILVRQVMTDSLWSYFSQNWNTTRPKIKLKYYPQIAKANRESQLAFLNSLAKEKLNFDYAELIYNFINERGREFRRTFEFPYSQIGNLTSWIHLIKKETSFTNISFWQTPNVDFSRTLPFELYHLKNLITSVANKTLENGIPEEIKLFSDSLLSLIENWNLHSPPLAGQLSLGFLLNDLRKLENEKIVKKAENVLADYLHFIKGLELSETTLTEIPKTSTLNAYEAFIIVKSFDKKILHQGFEYRKYLLKSLFPYRKILTGREDTVLWDPH